MARLKKARVAVRVRLEGKKEVNRVAGFVKSPVKVFPLACSLNIRFILPPTLADWVTGSLAYSSEHWKHLDGSPVNDRVIERYATFGQYFLQLPRA